MNHTVTQHRGGNAPADAHSGEGSYDLKPIYPAMLRVMELVGRPRINPADENYVPSGFEGYDKRTNGFARGTLTVISGWTLADSRNLQLDIVRHAAVSGLPSAIFCPRLSGYEIAVRIMSAETDMPMKAHLLGRQSRRGRKGDYATHSARFASICRCMSIQNDPLLWIPSWMPAAAEKNRRPETHSSASHRRHCQQFRMRIRQGAGQTRIIRQRDRHRHHCDIGNGTGAGTHRRQKTSAPPP